MKNYYAEHLSGERLQRCYDIAPPRIRQYLEAEIEFVLGSITPDSLVLELGCGYGRVMARIARKARRVIGIDISLPGLLHARTFLAGRRNCSLVYMDALRLGFPDDLFNVVVCIQNGVAAFRVDEESLIRESIRVTRSGGRALFSSYSEKFWDHRLDWFYRQAEEGLLGDIDREKTKGGVIMCTDGFVSSTIGRDRFSALASRLGEVPMIDEVDESSIFYTIAPRKRKTVSPSD